MITFVDIDGVVHPHPPRKGALFGESQIRELASALEDIGAQVVIISSWREEVDKERLIQLLGPVGRFVIDLAPEEPAFTSTPRQLVVEQWLAASGDSQQPWLAIDDHPAWYGAYAAQVVAPDPRVGFTSLDGHRLRQLADRKAF